jgi:CRP/FNR family transcriptional regulator
VRPGGFCILTVTCLLREASYAVRGVAEEDLLGVAIPAQLFTRILKQATDFPIYLLHYFGKGLPELIDLIECVTFMRLNQRLATLLLSKGPLIETTHQKLADELGSVREVVSRILKDFEDDKILRLERGHIHILDRLSLEKIASDIGD